MAKHLLFGLGFLTLSSLVTMSVISLPGDAGSVLGGVLFVLWCTWAPLLSGTLLYFLHGKSAVLSYIAAGSFFGSSGFSLSILGRTTAWVIESGPLRESGMVFIVMPAVQATGLLVGGVVGVLAYWAFQRFRSA